jgi:hypothetical protein
LACLLPGFKIVCALRALIVALDTKRYSPLSMLSLHFPDQGPSAGGPEIAHDGFSATDLIALGKVHAAAITGHFWRRAQLASNEFAHYLAVWGPKTRDTDPPGLALARFKKTGTYVLTIGVTIVASGKSLGDVLPALASRFDAAVPAGWP